MKQIELDLEYINNLIALISKLRVSSELKTFMAPYNKVVVAGGAIRDMLFNKPVSDIDVFYEGELKGDVLKKYFPNVVTSNSVYPDGFNVTHNFMCDMFPVKVQLIQVENIEKHLETFPSPMMRLYVDGDGIHGLGSQMIQDALTQIFFWDKAPDLSYYLKIKSKYSDWKHEFMEKHFNPESELEAIDLEF